MAAGDEGTVWAGIVDRLCAEFGYDGAIEELPPSYLGRPYGSLFGDLLSPEEEELIAEARRTLARVAVAVGTEDHEGAPEKTICLLLDGAEWVMRGELARGNPLSAALPSFIYLVAVSALKQDEALALSHRASVLLEESRA
jgi:hypothetical protein